jgi:hypothetical protein
VAAGFSPLDEELGLLPGAWTPPLQRHLSRLGTRLSFAEAASELAELRGVTVSAATARRRTEADGAVLVGLEDAEAARLAQTGPPPPRGPAVQQLSVDGTLVPLVGGEWGEVKVVAIGTVESGRAPDTVQATDLSYFGRRAEAAAFAEAARGEVHRRGVETAGTVAAVSDGAPWCQGFVDRHRPDAVRILDYPHASQRLADVAEAVWGEGCQAKGWAARQRTELLDGEPDRVLRALRVLPAELPEEPEEPEERAGGAEPVLAAGAPPAGVAGATDGSTPPADLSPAAAAVRDEVLGYLEPRRAHLAYATFRTQGLPIGSGIVESGGKTVVAARLKGAGRRWAPAQINPLVALRGVLCSGRWDERWPQLGRARRAQAQQRAQARRLARRPAPPAPAPVAVAPAAPRRQPRHPAIGRLPASGRPKLVVNGRPTAQHPYKRTYRPPQPPVGAPPAKL